MIAYTIISVILFQKICFSRKKILSSDAILRLAVLGNDRVGQVLTRKILIISVLDC